jgi:tetratricopeptide (TPR) repeat protein
MKTAIVLAVAFASQCAAQDQLSDLLRKAVVEEDVNHNLDAAIKQYRAILDRYRDDRTTAATALFRAAECYRKLGETTEADAAYNQLIAQFPDQTALVDRSRQLRATQPAAKPPIDTTEMQLLHQKYDLAVQHMNQVRHAMELGLESQTELKQAQTAVIRAQLSMLNQQAAAVGPAADDQRRQRRVLLEQLVAIAQESLAEEERRFRLGAVGPDAVNQRKSQLLDLQLELERNKK